jgi:signal transduction histidine kinase
MTIDPPDVPPKPSSDPLGLLTSFCAALPFAVELFDRAGQCVFRNRLAEATTAAPDPRVQEAALALLTDGTRPADTSLRLIPLGMSGREPSHVAAVFFSLADTSAALAREQQSRLAAEAANRMKDEFLALVSHELRTPLNSMLGWTHMLRTQALSPEKVAKGLERIERNAELQTRLVEDLLDLGRILSGKLQMTPKQAELNQIVLSAWNTVRATVEQAGLTAELALSPTPLALSCDPDRIEQVVSNLINNAVKFTGRGGRISLQTVRREGAVELRVGDTGAGISPAFLPHVFERFRQADQSSTRRLRGLGLGLALVKHVIEAHRGTVEAQSPGEGQGATFTVVLPVGEDPAGLS